MLIQCNGCGAELSFEDVHTEEINYRAMTGIHHACSCGYDLSSGFLGKTYNRISDDCELCEIFEERDYENDV